LKRNTEVHPTISFEVAPFPFRGSGTFATQSFSRIKDFCYTNLQKGTNL